MNLMSKTLLLIALLLIPVIVLYMVSNQRSIALVEEQINRANQSRLAHFLDEIESTMEQVSRYSNLIGKDPDFAELAGNAVPADRYAYSELMESAERKLGLFSLSTDWASRISLYFPASGRSVSSHPSAALDEAYLNRSNPSQWTLRPVTVNGVPTRAFTRYFIEPPRGITDLEKASVIVEVDLMENNIVKLLDSFKAKGNHDPFLYRAPGQFVLNSSSDAELARRISEAYDLEAGSASKNHDTIRLDSEPYLIYFLKSPDLHWTLVDYVPLENILAPVTQNRYLFYVTVALLLLVGAGAAFLLYVHVQIPVKLLTESVGRLRQGEFSVRITGKTNREFQRLVAQFNEMAAQIQHLVEKVYLEEIRSKEAVMKQLQSQINPHFLYNSLAYIVSMAKMNRTPPIVTMAYSLADYYRYTTRTDSMATTVREEIAFVMAYMDIMNHQLGRIRAEISIPEAIADAPIPRLIVQPVVENAILHGLEAKPDSGLIRIAGSERDGFVSIVVEDDGIGLTPAELGECRARLDAPDASGGIGLRNVHQRLRYQFGEPSGVTLEASAAGGLKVTLRWRKPAAEEGGDEAVLPVDRG